MAGKRAPKWRKMYGRRILLCADAFALASSNLGQVQITYRQRNPANPNMLFERPKSALGWAEVAPLGALFALTLELYLKTLQTIDRGEYSGGHKLNVLFNSLRTPTKRLIREEYYRLLQTDEITRTRLRDNPKMNFKFEKRLAACSNAFTFNRYLFESKRLPRTGGWTGAVITRAVRNVIAAKKPSWHKWVFGSLKHCQPKFQFHQMPGQLLALSVCHAPHVVLCLLPNPRPQP